MSQYLPDTDLAPKMRPGLTNEQRLEAWLEVMDWSDELLLAGLQHDLSDGTTLREAVRSWCRQRTIENDKKLENMMRELSRRERNHGN